MAHEGRILEIMQKLVIANIQIIVAIAEVLGIWQAGDSSYQNVYKCLSRLVKEGKLLKEKNYYKLPTCKSNNDTHAKLVTEYIAEVLKLNLPTQLYREIFVKDISIRPDFLCLLVAKGGDKATCFVVEVVNHETEQYLASKIHAWQQFEGALDYLSNLFAVKVPHFLIATTGEPIDGAVQFNQLLMEVKNESHRTEKL